MYIFARSMAIIYNEVKRNNVNVKGFKKIIFMYELDINY